MATELRRIGFDVLHDQALDHSEMREAIRELGRKLRKSDVGLFYSAGPGMQVPAPNMLSPRPRSSSCIGVANATNPVP